MNVELGRRPRLEPAPRLVAITDLERASAALMVERFSELAGSARPGSVVFQLRDRERPVRERLELGRALLQAARRWEQRLLVNDRLDLALLLGADGVHLGEHSVDTSDARKLLGTAAFISRAVHESERVAEDPADAMLLSPILAARKARPPIGLEALSAARRALAAAGSPALLFALGGVDETNAAACISAGADGVAVLGALLGEAPRLGALIDNLEIRR